MLTPPPAATLTTVDAPPFASAPIAGGMSSTLSAGALSEPELARLLVGRISIRGCARVPESSPLVLNVAQAASVFPDLAPPPPWTTVSGMSLVSVGSDGATVSVAGLATPCERYDIHLGQRSVTSVPILSEFTLANQTAQPVDYRIRTLRASDRVRRRRPPGTTVAGASLRRR